MRIHHLALLSLFLAATLTACEVAEETGSSSPGIADAAGDTISINAGGSATGSFVADAYFSGGSTYSTTNTIDTSQISGTVPPQAVFQSERYGEFTYTVTNRTAGSPQTVTLYFQESYWTAAGQRTFNVAINGATVLTAFDIFAQAGGANRAISRTFNTTANSSGQVVIQFTRAGGPDNPKICGITLVEGGVAVEQPISVNSGGSATGGFVADAYYSGGSTYTTTNTIDTTQISGTVPPQAVFQSERYGEFTYTIPNRTPGSAQAVTLYFQESYWTAAGQRTFNVAINGATVLTAFDIFAQAGGANRAISRTFNTTASSSGQVVIQFTRAGGPDNPKICGITVAPSGGGGNTLTVSKAGNGTGTVTSTPAGINCGSTCSGSFASGAVVTLSASAASGSTFGGWSGACSGTSTTCTVTVSGSQTAVATFNAQGTTYALTVTKAGNGSGTVTSNPSGINCGSTCTANYSSGTSVTLSAAAASGSTFGGWSGACTGTGTCVASMTAARSVTATFNGSSGDTRPSAGCGKTRTLQNGTITIQSNGSRTYVLRAPDNYSNTRPYRLVMAYHWLNGSAQNVVSGNYYGMLPLSNNSTIFVAPQGLNAGWANTNGQDIAFTDAMLNQLQNELCIDLNRIFATGFSYGAGMSFAIACQRADVFRGVALYAGAQLSGCTGGTTPIAYFATHGLSDSVLNISQGRTLRDRFVRNNGCTAQNPPEPAVGSGTHICTSYQNCSAGHPVRWCAFDGDHTPTQTDRGQSSSWIPGEAWNFINQF